MAALFYWLLEVAFGFDVSVVEPLLPQSAVGHCGPYQLLLRSQGPRGPIAIACPITTHNQSPQFVPQHLLGRILDASLASEEYVCQWR